MNLLDVKNILQAEVICGAERLETIQVLSVCGSDLMSDVLAFTKEKTLLLTGLTNPQVIRTAEIIDLVGVVFVRGKKPPVDVIQLAQSKEIPIMLTNHPLFETCGVLFRAGLKGCRFGMDGEIDDQSHSKT